jgi:hypothetical protein
VGTVVTDAELAGDVVAAFVLGTVAASFASAWVEVAGFAAGFWFCGLGGGSTFISGLEAAAEDVAGDAGSGLAFSAAMP